MDPRVARCLLIAKVLAADGFMTESERAYLEETMEALGLEDGERTRVRNFDGFDEAEAVCAKMPMDARRVLVDELLQAAINDGKISPHERDAIAQLTTALGLA
jgi:tellurite resistance protein